MNKVITGMREYIGAIRLSRAHQFLVALVAEVLLFGLIAIGVSTAQSQPTQNVGGVRIFADTFQGSAPTGPFTATGNLKLGLSAGGAAVVDLLNLDNTAAGQAYVARRTANGPLVAYGKVKFVERSTNQVLLESKKGANGEMNIDTVVNRIQKRAGADQQYPMLDRFGITSWFTIVNTDTLAAITYDLDLDDRQMVASVPVPLKVLSNTESGPLLITATISVNNADSLSGSVSDFRLNYAGMTMRVSDIDIQPGAQSAFVAGRAEVRAVDNPSLPKLDPDAPTGVQLVLLNLRYLNGKFTINGGSFAIDNLKFGEAFELINANVSLANVDAANAAEVSIAATMRFGSVLSATNVAVNAKIRGVPGPGGTTSPVFTGTLANLTTKIDPVQFQLTNVSFLGNPQDDFWGIAAQDTRLRLGPDLGGGVGGGMSGFRFGVDKTNKVKFNVGGGSLTVPPINSPIISGTTLSGSFATVATGTLVITLTGDVKIRLTGGSTNSDGDGINPTLTLVAASGPLAKNSCTNSSVAAGTCIRRFSGSLESFSIRIGPFKFAMSSVKPRSDGGFEAGSASISVPTSLELEEGAALSTSVQNLRVTGNGDVSITGGSIEIPPIKVADVTFASLRGGFEQTGESQISGVTRKLYKFTAGGAMTIPGIDSGVSVNVELTVKPTGSFHSLDVDITATLPPGGIPIGTTGLVLKRITGSYEIRTSSAAIGLGMQAVTVESVNVFGTTLSIAVIDGQVTVFPLEPRISGDLSLKLVVFEVASAHAEIGNNAGFAGGIGAQIGITYTVLPQVTPLCPPCILPPVPVVIRGDGRVGYVSGHFRFRGTIRIDAGFPQDFFGPALPPCDVTLGNAQLTIGQFDVDPITIDPNNFDRVGALGTVTIGIDCIPFLPSWQASLFIDLRRNPFTDSSWVQFVDKDRFKVLTRHEVELLAELGVPGYLVLETRETEEAGSGPRVLRNRLLVSNPVVVDQPGNLLIGINYTGTLPVTPTVQLVMPGGLMLTQGTVNTSDQFFVYSPAKSPTGTTNVGFYLKNAPTGTYTLIADGAPSDFRVVSHVQNTPPTLNNVSANRVANSVTIGWQAADADSPAATVSVGYAKAAAGPDQIDLSTYLPITSGLGLGLTSTVWTISEVPTGDYRAVVVVEDDINGPVAVAAPLLITVVDTTAPAVPTGLTAAPRPGQLQIAWNANGERDLAGYEVGFGFSNNPAAIVYTRDVGSKIALSTTNQADARLWGLQDNQTVFFSVRAYDTNGNTSDWAPLVSAKPWAISPRVWTPTPNGTGTGASVEVAFNTTLIQSSLSGVFTVTGPDGSTVNGTTEFLLDLDEEQVIGLKFIPSRLMTDGTYTATLRGGAAGIKTTDGREMPENYSWSFTIVNRKTALPVVRK